MIFFDKEYPGFKYVACSFYNLCFF